jgi:hypothetical protein
MFYSKVRTGIEKTGNYGRFLIAVLFIAGMMSSCNLVDQPNTEDIMDNITGTWKCEETSTTFGVQNYEVIISKSSEMSVYINDFFSIKGMNVYAEVEGYTITIPKQTVDSYVISGSGTIASNYKKINWNYSITDASGTDTFTAIYTPQ